MQDLVGYPHVNRNGILVLQVYLDGDFGGGSNSFRWGALPLWIAAPLDAPRGILKISNVAHIRFHR